MFEALRWRNETAMRQAVNSLAQAGKTPLVIGSLAAMAVVGVLTTMGLNHKGRSKVTVIPARVRNAIENAMSSASSAPRNGRRRRRRKMKAAAAQKATTH